MHSRRKTQQAQCFKQQSAQASMSLVPVKIRIVARWGHAKRHPEPKTPTRTTIQRTRDLAIQCLDVGHQGVGIPACANLDIATCKRTRRRSAVVPLCCHEANTRQSGRPCAMHDMWTRVPELGLRWILPQAATCPVCKHESIPLLSSQGRARCRIESSAGRPISRFQMSN